MHPILGDEELDRESTFHESCHQRALQALIERVRLLAGGCKWLSLIWITNEDNAAKVLILSEEHW